MNDYNSMCVAVNDYISLFVTGYDPISLVVNVNDSISVPDQQMTIMCVYVCNRRMILVCM